MPCRIHVDGDTGLRLLVDSDAEGLHALIEANRTRLAAWLPWAAEQSIDDTLEFIRGARAQIEANDGFQVAVLVGSEIAGVVGYTALDWQERSTRIGYWLAAEREGRGTMTAAVAALTDHALVTWELDQAKILAATGNTRSRAIPERLEYRQEAILPEAQRVGGRDLDLVVYSMMAEDWVSPR